MRRNLLYTLGLWLWLAPALLFGQLNFTVSNTNDDGPGSLRDAVRQAGSGSAVIDFSPALAGDTIRLTSGAIVVGTTSLQIEGPGAQDLYVSGSKLSHIMTFMGGEVKIRGCSFVQGRHDIEGGAFRNMGAALQLYDVHFRNNESRAAGGALYNAADASVEMVNCVFDGNVAVAANSLKGGGAFYNLGSLMASNCSFSGNQSFSDLGSDAQGGAGTNEGACSLMKCSFSGNGASSSWYMWTVIGSAWGGALYNEQDANLECNSCTFDSNRCSAWGYFAAEEASGGAIYNKGTLKLTACLVKENVLTAGAPFYFKFPAGYGRGAGLVNEGLAQVNNCTFSRNHAVAEGSNRGGAIYNSGQLGLLLSTIAYNNSNSGLSSSSAGICNDGGIVRFDQCIVAHNVSGVSGGGEYVYHLHENLNYALQGQFISAGYNFFRDTTFMGFTPAAGDQCSPFSDLYNPSGQILDPLLDPNLSDQGGPTLVHALLPGSPAINAGNPASRTPVDQRGYARPAGGRSDIGAFESGADPLIVITEPADASVGPVGLPLKVAASVKTGGGNVVEYLSVSCPDNGWRKLKMGNNPNIIYGPAVNVTAGGNTYMEITLRDPLGTANWSKIEIHPNGSLAAPLVLANYLPAGGPGTGWFTMRIPLSAFAASINFAALQLLELPYSRAAGPFTLDLRKIAFTGGSAPYLWFGPGKTDNKHNGLGAMSDHLTATLLTEVEPVEYLKVLCPDNNWRKLKMGNNPNVIYGPAVDVTAGGNTMLELSLRDPLGTADWSKIEIHPNGSLAAPVVLGNYLPAGGAGTGWFNVSIPLSAYAPSVSFSALQLLELPYSQAAGPFELHIQRIEFSGGSTPYLWFGPGKTNNKHNGLGINSDEMTASLETEGAGGEVKFVTFYEGGISIGVDSVAPYEVMFTPATEGLYTFTAMATLMDGSTACAEAVSVTAVSQAMRPVSIEMPPAGLQVYPNPAREVVNVLLSLEEEVPARLRLMNLQGQSLWSGDMEVMENRASLSLPVEQLPNGVYLIQVQAGEVWHSKKLLKQ